MPWKRMSSYDLKLMIRFRKAAYKRQNGLCWWCKNPMHVGPPNNHPQQCSADHIIRLADGGLTTRENVVAACRKCNSERDQDHCASLVIPPIDEPRSSTFDVLKDLRIESTASHETRPRSIGVPELCGVIPTKENQCFKWRRIDIKK